MKQKESGVARKRLGSMFQDLGNGRRFSKKERAEFALMASVWLASVETKMPRALRAKRTGRGSRK